ncbi:MAG: glycosyltransferase family 4 protein [Candidatus Bathyarchaeia archaeon]|jgi:glycosyltransferase involved in cell wall biosynthesis
MKKPDVCVVTVPTLAFNEKVGLDNFIRLLLPSCNEIFVITGEGFQNFYGEKVVLTKLPVFKGTSAPSKVMHKLVDQIYEAVCLVKLSKKFSLVLFHAGVIFNQIPIVVAKLLRKRVVVYQFGGNYLLEQRLSAIKRWERVVKPMSAALSRVNYPLADVIICEGRTNLMKWDQLERYQEKIAWLVARDVDFSRYRIIIPPNERLNLIGYFGRLDPKKGILNFIRAMPSVLEKKPDVQFVIAGTGPIQQAVEREITTLKVNRHVQLLGFVADEDIPNLLNKLKVVVVPTYDDGIPEVMKEAMACGTVVVATSVGGIPDIVKDGVNAFLIRENSAHGVAIAILKAINSPKLYDVAIQGRYLIQEIYGNEKMVQRYSAMIAKSFKFNLCDS